MLPISIILPIYNAEDGITPEWLLQFADTQKLIPYKPYVVAIFDSSVGYASMKGAVLGFATDAQRRRFPISHQPLHINFEDMWGAELRAMCDGNIINIDNGAKYTVLVA